jgi:hypothetical protein
MFFANYPACSPDQSAFYTRFLAHATNDFTSTGVTSIVTATIHAISMAFRFPASAL